MGIDHSRSPYIPAEVQQYIRHVFFRISEPVEADTIGSRLFYPYVIFVQKESVITRLNNLSLMQERRFPGLLTACRVHFSRNRHHRQPGKHPAMNLRKAQHLRRVVIITAAVLIFISRQRCCSYHPIRLIACDKEEIASAGCLDIRIDPGYMIRIIFRRRKNLDLRKTDLRTGSIGHLEPYPLDLPRLKLDLFRSSVIRHPPDINLTSVTEMQHASGDMRIRRGTVV